MELLLGFLVALSVTMALIPPLMQLAARYQFLDTPNERKVHVTPVPRVGGIAMAAGMLLALALAGPFPQPMPAFIAGVLVLLVFGIWDDRCTLDARTKFLGQIIAVAIVMIWGDVAISSTTMAERHLMPQWLSLPLTFVFLLGVTNAINLADGLDGLAGGTTLLSLAALALLALTSGIAFVGGVAIVLMGAILGFLRFNTHPARVFMGDGGSQILGFAAGVLAVVLTQDQSTPLSSALPLLLLGMPIIDTLMVMTQRLLERRSPFSADRNHIHHRLLARGFDHHEAVVAIYLLQASMFVAAWFLRYESDVTIVSTFVAFSIVTIGLLAWAARCNWRWRGPAGAQTGPPSILSLSVAWLREPRHLPLWTLIAICSVVTAVFVGSVLRAPSPSLDVRVMSGAVAVLVGVPLFVHWRRAEATRAVRVALYVAIAIVTYLNHEAGVSRIWPAMQWALFGLLVVCIVIRFRLSGDRRFHVTSLDVLVIFATVIIPNLPGSVVSSAHLSESVARLIATMYGVETIFSAGARWWRIPSLAALLFLCACAIGGGF